MPGDIQQPPTGRVIDFQLEAISRLKAQVTALGSSNAELLAQSRGVADADQRLFAAVLAAMDADGLEHLIHIVTADWVDMLGMDAVVLALESGGQRFNLTASGIQLLAADGLVALLPHGQPLRIESVDRGVPLFGPLAPLVRRQALVRFGGSGARPAGLLALGTRQPEALSLHGGSVGLLFLAQVVERCIDRWLSLTP